MRDTAESTTFTRWTADLLFLRVHVGYMYLNPPTIQVRRTNVWSDSETPSHPSKLIILSSTA